MIDRKVFFSRIDFHIIVDGIGEMEAEIYKTNLVGIYKFCLTPCTQSHAYP